MKFCSIRISDVAKPLSYKTTYFFKTKPCQAKTTFSRPRPLVLKTIKFINPRPLA